MIGEKEAMAKEGWKDGVSPNADFYSGERESECCENCRSEELTKAIRAIKQIAQTEHANTLRVFVLNICSEALEE